jgi:FkbM family methyltransferase
MDVLRRLRPSGPTKESHWFSHTFQRLAAIKRLGFSPDVILDVGASDGRWTRSCLQVFPAARYICIEPLTENEPGLRALCSRSPNVAYRLCSVGAQMGQMTLNVDGAGSSVLRGHWDNPYGEQRQVMMETLDHLLDEGWLLPPCLVKLDVQGYELEVLKGAERVLPIVEAVIVETSFFSFQSGMPVFHQIVEFMEERDLVCYDVLGLFPRPLDGALAQAHWLFVKKDSSLRANHQWDVDSVY